MVKAITIKIYRGNVMEVSVVNLDRETDNIPGENLWETGTGKHCSGKEQSRQKKGRQRGPEAGKDKARVAKFHRKEQSSKNWGWERELFSQWWPGGDRSLLRERQALSLLKRQSDLFYKNHSSSMCAIYYINIIVKCSKQPKDILKEFSNLSVKEI